jgi:hypothetical protein
MPFPKTISEIESSTLIDLPGGGGSIEVPSLQEVVALDVTDKFAAIRPVHPRPVLPSRVAIIGNYLPRKCGIATFTTDLCDAIHGEYAATELLALPGRL